MKTLVLQTEKTTSLDLLYKLAKELGVDAKFFNSDDPEDKDFNALLAESSFAKDWNGPEDEVWNEFLKKK